MKIVKEHFLQIKQRLLAKFSTLKFRLMLLITLVLLIVVGGPLYFLVYQLDKNYHEFSINMIETTSQAVYQSVFEGFLQNDRESIQRNLELLSVEPNIQSVRIFKPGGKILFSSDPSEVNKSLYELSNNVIILPRAGTGEQETFVKEGNVYSHHHPIYIQKECLPCHANQEPLIAIMDVHVGLSQSEYIYSSSKRLTIISAILIVVILWIILNFLYEGQIESRLQKIISGFKELAGGNLNASVQMSGRHEIAQLANEFNQTVNKLKQAKEKETQFMQENLERADRLVTLGEVVAEIAHEVNNPASIILSRAEFLKDEMENTPKDGMYLDDVSIIIQQTERIAETTRSILHYARKLPHTFSETDLNQVIQRSIKILEPRINKVQARVDFRSFITPATIKGNSTQLEQVFCNLINNSLDVLAPGSGQISIQVGASEDNSQEYQVIFEDNGPGVPAEIRDQIFAPFFTTKKNGKGTGLGLYIVRNIVSYHQGKIALSSQNGRGAGFIIELGASNAKD
jgi:signal transduction histidine kinase